MGLALVARTCCLHLLSLRHDERYSRNVSSSLNLIYTCLFVLRVCSINVSNCFSYIATTNLCRGGRPRKLKRTETETLVLGYWLEIAVDVGTSLHQWAVREFMCLIPRSTIFQLSRGGQFYLWGNRSPPGKRATCHKSLTNAIT